MVWPEVEEAKKHPRDSSIPIPSLSRISSAKRMYEEDRVSEGNAYLIDGLREWSMAVDEGLCILSAMAGLALAIWQGKRC